MQCKIKQHSCFDEHIPYVNGKYIKCRLCENAKKNVKDKVSSTTFFQHSFMKTFFILF